MKEVNYQPDLSSDQRKENHENTKAAYQVAKKSVPRLRETYEGFIATRLDPLTGELQSWPATGRNPANWRRKGFVFEIIKEEIGGLARIEPYALPYTYYPIWYREAREAGLLPPSPRKWSPAHRAAIARAKAARKKIYLPPLTTESLQSTIALARILRARWPHAPVHTIVLLASAL